MAVLLNNVTTTDKYSDNEVQTPNAVGLSILIANKAVLCQFKRPPEGSSNESAWTDDLLLTPQTAQYRNVSGFRVKSAVSGQAAQVVAVLSEPSDPQALGATPYTASLSPNGSVTQGSVLTRVATLPAGPADLTQVLLDFNSTFPGVEWLCTFNSSTGYWDVIGPPLTVTDDNSDTINTSIGTFLEPAHNVRVTIPFSGDYIIGVEGRYFFNAAPALGQWVTELAYQVNNIAVAAGDTSYVQFDVSDVRGDMHKWERTKTALFANDLIKLVCSGNIAYTVSSKRLSVMPIRIH